MDYLIVFLLLTAMAMPPLAAQRISRAIQRLGLDGSPVFGTLPGVDEVVGAADAVAAGVAVGVGVPVGVAVGMGVAVGVGVGATSTV